MMKPKHRRAVMAAALVWAMQTSAGAAAPLYTSCEQIIDGDAGEKVVCQVRSTTDESPRDVRAALAGGGSIDYTLAPYAWTTHQSALYFLVETSGLSRTQMQRIGEFLDRAAYPVGKQTMGIASAGAALSELAPLGSYRLKLAAVARDLVDLAPAAGDSVLLSSLEDAIGKAAAASADRKAVVVLSGANPSASGLDEARLAALARDKKVALLIVSFGEAGQAPSDMLKRLGEETSGTLVDVSGLSQSDTMDLASRLTRYLENGVVLTVDPEGLPDSSEFTISAAVGSLGEVTSPPIRIERLTEDSWLVRGGKFLSSNLMAILAALGLGAGLVLIAASQRWARAGAFAAAPLRALGRVTEAASQSTMGKAALTTLQVDTLKRLFAGRLGGKSPAGPRAGDSETRILLRSAPAGGESEPQAWLELLDSDAAAVPLHAGSIRVGRSAENDIRLTNRSVHRHHAMLQMTSDGSFSIHDLGTKNGVFVNGTRYSRRELADGDLIELGEVKLRFVGQPRAPG